jgi:polyvinyl alcohol dehydrogenase (cytochrome)
MPFHQMFHALCLAVVGGLLAAAPAAAGWSMYNYDSAGSRHNPRERRLSPATVGSLHVAWTYPTVGAVTATPIVDGSRLFAGDQSGSFHALRATDGQHLWSTPLNGPVTATAFVANRNVVVGDLAGYIYGIDRRTGAINWQIRPNTHPYAQIFGSATKVGRYAAIGVASIESFVSDPNYPCCTARGSVVLLDPRDGRVVWQTYVITDADFALGGSGASVWSTPTYDRKLGLIFVTTGQNFSYPATGTSDAIIALDAETGAIRWVNQRLPNDVWTVRYPQGPENPDLDIGDSAQVYTLPSGQKVVGAGQKSGFFHVLDAATGDLVAVEQFAPSGGNGGLFADSAVVDGVIYANASHWVSGYPGPPVAGFLIAFSGDASEELWRFTVPGTANMSGVAVANGVVYFESRNGILYALDQVTGQQLAAVSIGASTSGPSVDRGRVFAGTGDPFVQLFTGTPDPGSIVALVP